MKTPILLVLLSIAPMTTRAADYVELTIELDSTWQNQRATNHYTKTVGCVVGTNGWHISGQFMKNAEVDYWFVGTNVVEHRTITSSMYVQQAKDYFSEKFLEQKPPRIVSRHPRAGETSTTIHSSPVGRPVYDGIAGVVWLAYCSGGYLKQAGRKIPMPLGPSSHAFGYSDKTVVFDDQFGLPKNVELFATNGTPVCDYKVLKATNYLGRMLPLQFQVIQRGNPADGSARSDSKGDVRGRVTSIKVSKPPELPEEVRKKLAP